MNILVILACWRELNWQASGKKRQKWPIWEEHFAFIFLGLWRKLKNCGKNKLQKIPRSLHIIYFALLTWNQDCYSYQEIQQKSWVSWQKALPRIFMKTKKSRVLARKPRFQALRKKWQIQALKHFGIWLSQYDLLFFQFLNLAKILTPVIQKNCSNKILQLKALLELA